MRFLVLVILAAGCKQSTRMSGEVASCNLASAGNCREYGAANLAAGSDNLARLCAIANTATFAMTACPTANAVGKCVQKEHTDVFYATYPIPAEDLEKSCRTSGGAFAKLP